MNILAVADKESSTLLHWIEHYPYHLSNLDLIVSCGDLPFSYLEYLYTTLGKDLVYVRGNHDFTKSWELEQMIKSPFLYQGPVYEEKFEGMLNLHGRLLFYKNWVLVGFEGSLWYNGEGPQYREEEMAKIIRSMEYRLRLLKLRDWFRGVERKIIVVSHAPPSDIHDEPDLCHKGFSCYHHLIKAFSPALWIHGHTSVDKLMENQVSHPHDKSTVLNCYEYRFIRFDEGQTPLISYKPSIFQEALLQ